ncbi:hypothetical protein ACFWUP_23470 [Nocardia sp. NPDC058658]|uniref:hypothetical protein n=1 Tax=Nocardia sp. NPDC058658 TaxID=3346580 RepID=UPI00364A75A4
MAVVAVMATGCSNSSTADGESTPSTTTSVAAAKPTGTPIGTATMQVTGGAGPVTIRYSINGAPEQTETDVTLPWSKDYPVYDQVQSSVSAKGASACTITMKGMLVAMKNEADPTCTFAYYG